MSIPDPEAIWKAGQEELKILFSSQLDEQDEDEQDEEEIEIIVDITDDKNLCSIALQHDYIVLLESSENSSSCSSGSEDLEDLE